MSERDALYRAVCSNPHDNTPRLVLADYLEEYGEPERAEFIRVQIELSMYVESPEPHPPRKPREGTFDQWQMYHRDNRRYRNRVSEWKSEQEKRLTLLSRERELFAAHGREWFGANARLPMVELIGAPVIEVVRGFPSHWLGPWREWVGGECGCVRRVNDTHIAIASDCPDCKGSGRIPGACHRAWKPSWAMECERCKGRGGFHNDMHYSDDSCSACNSTGRISMPMPDDALPITDVTLTTVPPMANLIPIAAQCGVDLDVWPRERGRERLCEVKWPSVMFHLPG